MSVSVSSAKAWPSARVPEGIPLPWLFRPVLALPGRSLWIAAAAVLLAVLLDLFWFNVAGLWHGFYTEGVPYWRHPIASLNVTYELGLGFVVLATIQLVRGIDEDVRQLAPALPPESLAQVRREVLGVSERSLRWGTALGIALMIFDLWIGYTQGEILRHSLLAQLWEIAREFLYTVWIVRVLAFGLISARRLSRVARERVHVDLLDLRPLEPFTRNGLRLALYWLLLWSIWVPAFATPSLDQRAFVALAVLIAIQVVLAGTAIAISTKGARERVRQTKHAALAEVRAAIARDRIAAIDPGHAGSAGAATRLPALLAWEARVAAVPETLVDSEALGRMGLYVLIPLGSWVASAAIEWVFNWLMQ